jgi:hypothetical protein
MFFDIDNDSAPPVFQRAFCNWHEMVITEYRRGIDELLREDTHLYKGHVVNLWPEGYKVSISPTFYEELFCTKVFCTALNFFNYSWAL